MNDEHTYSVIGIDGGGTSCRIGLILDGRRHEVRAGSANVSSDFNAAVTTITQGLNAVAEQAGVTLADLTALPAYLGLAGVLDGATGQRVAQALPLSRARVEDDRISTLAGALAGASGTVAGIGTGSFLARQSAAGVQLIGGYGLLVGDEASGAWLGRALITGCLHALDGLIPATPLLNRCLNDFDRSAAKLVGFAKSATPADFGQYAPDILTAAQEQDSFALQLVQRGVGYISDGLTALGWQPGEAFCLTGGVGQHYAPFLPAALTQSMTPAKGNGLDGALLLAAGFAADLAADLAADPQRVTL